MEENNGLSAEDVEKKLRAIAFVKDMYPNFEDYEYEVAVEIGNMDYFESEERDVIIHGQGTGNRLHYIFIIRVYEYLSSRRQIKETLKRLIKTKYGENIK